MAKSELHTIPFILLLTPRETHDFYEGISAVFLEEKPKNPIYEQLHKRFNSLHNMFIKNDNQEIVNLLTTGKLELNFDVEITIKDLKDFFTVAYYTGLHYDKTEGMSLAYKQMAEQTEVFLIKHNSANRHVLKAIKNKLSLLYRPNAEN